MRRVWNRLFGGQCQHTHALVVSSVGVRRTVCEGCGDISFEMAESSLSKIKQRPVSRSEMPKASGL